MLTSDKEISKIEKTFLKKHLEVSLVSDRQAIVRQTPPVFPNELIHGTFENVCQIPGGCPGVHKCPAPGLS